MHISGYYLIGYLDYVANRGLLLQEYGELLLAGAILAGDQHGACAADLVYATREGLEYRGRSRHYMSRAAS